MKKYARKRIDGEPIGPMTTQIASDSNPIRWSSGEVGLFPWLRTHTPSDYHMPLKTTQTCCKHDTKHQGPTKASRNFTRSAVVHSGKSLRAQHRPQTSSLSATCY